MWERDMSSPTIIACEFWEDGAATCLARVTADDASGSATGISGEGKWIRQADLSSISCAVFDESSSTPDTAIATPSIVVSSVIIDTPVTDGVLWDVDPIGYNFKCVMAAASFPTGSHIYRIEFKFTTTGSAVFWVVFRGSAKPVRTS
jgi:hypothetical protein